jgi:hypothetical protein
VLTDLKCEVGSKASRIRRNLQRICDSGGDAILPRSDDAVRCDNFIAAVVMRRSKEVNAWQSNDITEEINTCTSYINTT